MEPQELESLSFEQIKKPEPVKVLPNGAKSRIKKELRDMENERQFDPYFKWKVDPEDMTKIHGIFFGLKQTPYEQGQFEFLFDFTVQYPYRPPTVTFKTKIFHPNIGQDGKVCIDFLEKDSWTPALTLRTTLLSVLSILAAFNPMQAANKEAGALMLKSKNEFWAKAKEWTKVYAKQKEANAGENAGHKIQFHPNSNQ